jgi:hypothetical protein
MYAPNVCAEVDGAHDARAVLRGCGRWMWWWTKGESGVSVCLSKRSGKQIKGAGRILPTPPCGCAGADALCSTLPKCGAATAHTPMTSCTYIPRQITKSGLRIMYSNDSDQKPRPRASSDQCRTRHEDYLRYL